MEQPTRILSMLKQPMPPAAAPAFPPQIGGKPPTNGNLQMPMPPMPLPGNLPPGMVGGPPVGADGENIITFGFRMAETINAGFLTLSIAVGRHLGLFDILGSFQAQPKTSQEIADAAGLKERYVREWIGAMVTARIVQAEGRDKFFLPPHRAFFLGRGGPGEELAILSCALPVQSLIFENIVECFKKEGPKGVNYKCVDRFHGFMSECSNIWWSKNLISTFIPSVSGLREKLESGVTMLDVGCGEGGATIMLAKHFRKSRFIAIDICEYAIKQARLRAKEAEVDNVTFQVMDAHLMPDEWANRYDYVLVSDSLHEMAHVGVVLRRIKHVLKPECYMSVLEVNARSNIVDNMNMPFASTFYTNSLFHCLAVHMDASDGAEGHGNMWGREKTTIAINEGGFDVESSHVPEGWFNIHYVCKKTRKDSTTKRLEQNQSAPVQNGLPSANDDLSLDDLSLQ